MKDSAKQEPTVVRSKKRLAIDDSEETQGAPPSPSQSTTAATPKRLRLTSRLQSGTLSHLKVTQTPTKAPLTPQTPSKKPSRKQQLATDPINVSIYSLRKEGRAWDDIATRTNEACGLSETDELTAAACYSRFFRNGPLVAKEKGEKWRKESYVHMKGPVAKAEKGDETGGGEDETEQEEKANSVLQAIESVKAGFWASVVEVVNEGSDEGKQMSEEDVKAIYDRVAKDEA